MSIIKVNEVSKSFGEKENFNLVLDKVSLDIKKGEFVSLMGESGSGKSTLLYIIGGLDKPTEGSVVIDEKDINELKEKEIARFRRQDIGFVFQFYNLVQNLTVEENIMLPVVMDGKKEKDYKDRLDKILKIVGLEDKRKSLPNQLSGGQQQRVSIARAVILNPKVILADEFLHPGQSCGIFPVHPMTLSLQDVRLMNISLWRFFLQAIQFFPSLCTFHISVIGRVISSTPYHKGQIAQVLQPYIARVSGHHRRCRKMVGKSGSQTPHTITASRISHQIYLVGIDSLADDHHLNQLFKHLVNRFLKPHVPGIPWSSRCNVYSFRGFIKVLLIVPLTVIELMCGTATAVHGDPKTPLAKRSIAIGGIPKRQGIVPVVDGWRRSFLCFQNLTELCFFCLFPCINYFNSFFLCIFL